VAAFNERAPEKVVKKASVTALEAKRSLIVLLMDPYTTPDHSYSPRLENRYTAIASVRELDTVGILSVS
jgi:hypothetical protein